MIKNVSIPRKEFCAYLHSLEVNSSIVQLEFCRDKSLAAVPFRITNVDDLTGMATAVSVARSVMLQFPIEDLHGIAVLADEDGNPFSGCSVSMG